MPDLTKHYLISGRVQGVGYRAFTQHTAATLQIKGWARNLSDGRVEVVAQGSASQLEAFETELRAGPPHGRVETMTVDVWKTPDCDTANLEVRFEVRKDGLTPCSAP